MCDCVCLCVTVCVTVCVECRCRCMYLMCNGLVGVFVRVGALDWLVFVWLCVRVLDIKKLWVFFDVALFV